MSQKQIETTKIENIFTDTFDSFSSLLKGCQKTYLQNFFIRMESSSFKALIEFIFFACRMSEIDTKPCIH